jgi:hypothetical protein
MCGNLLFATCTDFRSVGLIIMVDLAGNVAMTTQAMFHFQSHEANREAMSATIGIHLEVAKIQSRMREKDVQMHQQIQKRDQQILDLFSRVKDLEAGNDWLQGRPTLYTPADLGLAEGGNEPEAFNEEDTCLVAEIASADDDSVEDFPLNLGMTLMIKLTLSEYSEVASSIAALLILPFLYYGPNKQCIAGMRELDDDGFVQTMAFSTVDVVAQAASLKVLMACIKLYTRVDGFRLTLTYLEKCNGFLAVAVVAFLVPNMAIQFFLDHDGVDPTFSFAWLDNTALASIGNTTSSLP